MNLRNFGYRTFARQKKTTFSVWAVNGQMTMTVHFLDEGTDTSSAKAKARSWIK